MSLDQITGGESLEMIIFWSIGAIILGIGAVDTIYKEYFYERKNKTNKDSK